jgi:hypothetical protein
LVDFIWGKYLRAKLGNLCGALVGFRVHSHLSSLGNKTNYQSRGIGQIEPQTTVGVNRGFAVSVQMKAPGFGSDGTILRK